MTWNYYRKGLAGERLQRVYEIAPPRVQRYLRAEIAFVLERIDSGMVVLELGCGYGRALASAAQKARRAAGIDNSLHSLRYGLTTIHFPDSCCLAAMDAARTGFADNSFDLVYCIQNGLSAFHVEPLLLIREAMRVTRAGGRVLFSTYSKEFWDSRMEWFRLQAAVGLLGEIDEEETRDGRIVCVDGFTATAFSAADLLALSAKLNAAAAVTEVDCSSLFMEITI